MKKKKNSEHQREEGNEKVSRNPHNALEISNIELKNQISYNLKMTCPL
jgi:hypothetical protein